MILGLTGGIGSGKSTVANILKSRGFIHIDADAVCREVTEDKLTLLSLAAEFGNEILDKDCRLDRKKLADIVFSDSEKLKKLNSIVQTAALNMCLGKIRACKSKNLKVVFDVPLMFEAGWNIYCDKVITVCADTDVRIKRVMDRDGCSESDVLSRMSHQLTDEERKTKSDIIVENNGNEDQLAASVFDALAKYNIL